MTAPKEKTPNGDIDNAIKHLMKSLKPRKKKKGEDESPLAPDEIKAQVAVIATAMKWEQIKHNIKDGEGLDPEIFPSS